MRFTLGLLCALCAFAGAFAARLIDLSQEERFESVVPAIEEHSELTDFAQSTRSLLQTYPPPSPDLEEVGGSLNNDEGVSSSPIQVSGELKVLPETSNANSTERESIMQSVLGDVRGGNATDGSQNPDEATIRKIKPGSRRLLSARGAAEKLLDDALIAAIASVSGEIRLFLVRNDDGTVVGDSLDFEINLYVPEGLSDEERQANADDSENSVNNNSGDVADEWEDGLKTAVANSGLSAERQAELNAEIDDLDLANNGVYTPESIASDTGSGATTGKAGFLGLFISIAAVLLLA